MQDKTTLKEIAKLFFKTWNNWFEVPAAHIAMMRQEVVVKKNGFQSSILRSYWSNKLNSGS
jgi:chromate transport protein ChrA